MHPGKLDPLVDPQSDHILGPRDAEITLVEYGSYSCPRCHAVHEVVKGLRHRFGDQMNYVFRHLPISGNEDALRAAELAEYAEETQGRFWNAHQELMERGPVFAEGDLEEITRELGLPEPEKQQDLYSAARERVREDIEKARTSGAVVTPTFFINGRRYLGAWDESSLADAMLGTLGHRIQSAAFQFVRWGPSSGLLLGLATVLALVMSNTAMAAAYASLWSTDLAIRLGSFHFEISLIDWINHGLLTIFFFVVGLEIKREFSVGHLASFSTGALPVIAAFGGILVPAVTYIAIAPSDLMHGWGIPIGTDTAFAVALIVLLGNRVPIELRVFLTAAVIIDDIVAILVIALFYTGVTSSTYLAASAITVAMLVVFNKIGVYRVLPYAIAGLFLWYFVHEAGLHATLAGVLLAVLIPTRPPANMAVLLAQAATVIHEEELHRNEAMRTGPSKAAMRALDSIHERIESPADKLLRLVEPWSSYVVLPIFALANAGVAWSADAFSSEKRLMTAIILGLVVGKPVGILSAAWLAVKTGFAVKPEIYSWRQLAGAGALGGIGFTMSLFIAGLAFPDPAEYTAGKIGIFIASLIAAVTGTALLYRRRIEDEDAGGDDAFVLKPAA